MSGAGLMADAPAARAPRSRHPLQPVFEAATVRARCAQVLQSVERGLSAHFMVKRAALTVLADQVADRVAHQVAAHAPVPDAWQAFPWPQLSAAGVDRLAELSTLLAGKTPQEQVRARLDLALVTVLLSTDIGPLWRCTETRALPTAAFVHAPADDLLALLDSTAPPRAASTSAAAPGDVLTSAPTPPESESTPAPEAAPPAALSPAQAAPLAGPEGLAVAVFRAFVAGAFSADRRDPCRVDAAALRHVDVSALRALLQGTPTNPVPALEGRAQLLSRLGALLQGLPQLLQQGGPAGTGARACSLLEGLPGLPSLDAAAPPSSVDPDALLTALLLRLAPAWAVGSNVQGLPAGDVWQHLWAGDRCDDKYSQGHDRSTGGWVPLHAQGLQLLAALQGPLQQMGCGFTAQPALPASACRSTSTLMLRAQVLVPRHARLLQRNLKPADDAVVECRAATVALFDELALLVQQRLAVRGLHAAAAPTAAGLVQICSELLHSQPAVQLTVEGDGALF